MPLVAHLSNSEFRLLLDQLHARLRLCEGKSGAEVEVVASGARKLQPQHRLQAAEIDELEAAYRAGDPVKVLTARFRVDAKTIYGHMKRRDVPRRRSTLADVSRLPLDRSRCGQPGQIVFQA